MKKRLSLAALMLVLGAFFVTLCFPLTASSAPRSAAGNPCPSQNPWRMYAYQDFVDLKVIHVEISTCKPTADLSKTFTVLWCGTELWGADVQVLRPTPDWKFDLLVPDYAPFMGCEVFLRSGGNDSKVPLATYRVCLVYGCGTIAGPPPWPSIY